MIENFENCKNCMKKLPQKIDFHQCSNLLEILFGWRDITQKELLKYGGGKFSVLFDYILVFYFEPGINLYRTSISRWKT